LSDLTTKRDYLEKLEEEELSKGDDTVALKEFDISKIFQSWVSSASTSLSFRDLLFD
jgi:hypothetical protein